MEPERRRHPASWLDSPPGWLAAGVVLALVQARWLPLLAPGGVARGLAVAAWAGGVVLMAAAAWQLHRARTTIIPGETPAHLVTRGPYALTRNPIYLADLLILAGVALWVDLAGLVLVPVLHQVLTRRFVLGEEARCRAAFGPRWLAYAARVPRWLGRPRA